MKSCNCLIGIYNDQCCLEWGDLYLSDIKRFDTKNKDFLAFLKDESPKTTFSFDIKMNKNSYFTSDTALFKYCPLCGNKIDWLMLEKENK